MWIDKKFLFSWILWVAYVFAGSAGGYSNAIKQCIIPCVIYGYFATGKPNLKSFIFYYFAGLVTSSIVALFIEQIPNMSLYVSYDMAYELDDVVRFSGLYTDPNYYSLAIMLVWSSLIVLYLYGKIKNEIFLFTVILIFFGIQTVSKSFLLMLAVICLGFVLFLFQKKKYKIAIVLSVGIIIACVLVFSGQIHIFDNVLERLFSGNDLTTGRTEIWGDFFEVFYENPLYVLVGAGSGAGYVNGHPAHNTYIDFFYYYGLCGTFLFGVTCFYASANERFSKSISSYLPGIAMIFMFGFLSCLIYYDFSFTLLAILVAGKTELNPETKGANWKNGNSVDWIEYESDGNIR